MNLKEFSDSFDVLLNSYSITPEFGKIGPFELDEYEKSIFLTTAQEEIVLELYDGTNPKRHSFESTEENRRYLSTLVDTISITPITTPNSIGLTKNSQFFSLPKELWFITYESATIEDVKAGCLNHSDILVTPVTQDEFFDIKDNPFRGPNNRRALRLDINNNSVELISKYKLSNYKVRYLKKPTPIILVSLGDLQIEGEIGPLECKLNPVLHNSILERAVRLAILSRAGNK